jgi:uncharacterized protein
VESYHYFGALGYVNIAFVPGAPAGWTSAAICQFEDQFNAVADILIDEYRMGKSIVLKEVDEAIQGIVRNQRPRHACGAGRGLFLVDIHGDIWPCHRWNKQGHGPWRIGSIYEHFNELARQELDRPCQTDLLEQDCEHCPANLFCSGGCPAENLEETGYVYRRHPNACELTRVWARVGRRVHDILYAERNEVFFKRFYNKYETVADRDG